MKSKWYYSVSITFLSLVTMMFFVINPAGLYAQESETSIGTVSYLEGNCYIKPKDHSFQPLRIHQPVFSQDHIKTEVGSTVDIELTEGSTIHIAEDSEITLNESILRKTHYTDIGLLFGMIRLFVKKLEAGSEYSVNTVAVTAGVRGTKFEVSTRDDGDVLIAVDEGIVSTAYEQKEFTVKKGESVTYTLSGKRQILRKRIDPAKWRRAALAQIRKNPVLFLNRMLDREKKIISRLKELQSRLGQYRSDWRDFVRRVRILERRRMYKQEKQLIERQIVKTKKGLLIVVGARRQLTAIRSIIALSYRIERQIGPERAKKLPTLQELRREYVKISYIIKRLRETEDTLKKVLFILNRKYNQLQE